MATKKRIKTDEAMLMHRHGTAKVPLTAGAVRSAAEADIRAKEYNAVLRAERKEHKAKKLSTKALGTARKYSFLGKHVSRAATAQHLIKLAIDRNADAAASVNINTRRIYDSVPSLHEALKTSRLPDATT